MKKPTVSAIAAIGKSRQIGKDGDLLWHIPDDLKRFKKLTKGHVVIMGRKTWESLPEKVRPLPGRKNIVVTRQHDYKAPGAELAYSLEEAFSKAGGEEEIFIIGGAEIYKQALPFTDKLYLCLVDFNGEADSFFPPYENIFTKETFREKHEHDGLKYEWINLER